MRRGPVRFVLGACALLLAAGPGCGVSAGDAARSVDGRPIASDDELSAQEQLEIAQEQNGEAGSAGLLSNASEEERACFERELGDDLSSASEVAELLQDPEGRTEVIRSLIGCLDDPANHPILITSVKGNLTLLNSALDPSDDEVSCILGSIIDESDDPARSLAVGTSAEDVQFWTDAADSCLSEANLGVLYGEEGSGPQAYGDDARFDGMQDDCEAGNDRACDLLYLVSSTGSSYEDVGATCAGRQPAAETFCSPEAELDDSGFAPAGHPGLDVLAGDCVDDGDLTACDLLYLISAPGTEAEEVGTTCGGRVLIAAIPDCRTRLG